MATARMIFDERGKLLAFCRDDREIAQFGSHPRAAASVDFDPETNAGLIAGVDYYWNAWSFDGANVRQAGEIYPINPPGECKQLEDESATLIAALRASGWDGLTAAQRTKMILYLIQIARRG